MNQRFRSSVLVVLFMLSPLAAFGDVTVTAASGGTGVSADTAANATSPQWTLLGDIVIDENANGEFATGTGVTLVLSPPTGWKFSGSGSPGLSVQHQSSRNISSSSIAVAGDGLTATVTYTVGGTDKDDKLTLKNLRVQPSNGLLTSTPNGNITRSASSTGTMTGLTGTTNFGSLSMTFGAAKKLGVGTQPTTATAGLVFSPSPVVRIEDQFTNLVTSDNTSDVIASRNSGSGTAALQGTLTGQASSGLVTFSSISYNKAETIRIDFAEDHNNPSLTGVTSANIAVSAAAAAKLRFATHPGGATAGSAFSTQPVVKTADAFDNDSANGLGATVTVTFSINTGTGTLLGTTAFNIGTAGGNGTVTATNLQINQAGSFTLAANDGGALTDVVSNSFTVAAGAPATISRTAGDAQTAPAGSTLPTDPAVHIEDAYGNDVSGVEVTFTPESGSGSVTGGTQSTNSTGDATVTSWTLGELAGTHTLNVAAGALSTSFTATATCAYASKQSGNWNAAATWLGGCVPTAADAATISSGHTVTVTASAAAASLTFASTTDTDSSVVINTGIDLTVSGLVEINAPATSGETSSLNVGDGILSAGSMLIEGAGNRVGTMIIGGAGEAAILGDLSFGSNQSTQVIEVNGNGRLNVGGKFGADGDFDLSTGATFRMNGSAPQTIAEYNPSESFQNLVIAGDVTLLGKLTILGTLTIDAGSSLDAGSDQLRLEGDFVDNGSFTSTGMVKVQGKALQTFSGSENPIPFDTLQMLNSAGLALQTSVTVADTLVVDGGNIDAGENTVTILAGADVDRTEGHVIGYLAKVYTAAGSKSFEVGTANGYSPATVNATAGSFPATFTTRAVQGAHPESPATNALERYFKVSSDGITEADLTFTYRDGDVSGNESLYEIAKYDAGWSYPAGTVYTADNYFVAGGVTSFSDWTLHSTAAGIRVASVNGGVNPTAGTPFSIVVESVDADGNVAPAPGDSEITLTLDTGTGTLGGTLAGTLLTGENSMTFSNVTYTKAEGGVVVTASSTDGAELGSDDSDAFTVDPGPPDALTITAPGSSTAGEAFDVTVTVRDAYGNVTPSFTGTVDLSSSDGQATLPADYTFTVDDAGAHTFTGGVTLRTAGSQTISADSGLLTGEATVAVGHAKLDHFIVDSAAGGSIPTQDINVPFSIRVRAFDDFSNAVQSFTGTVDITSTGTLSAGGGTTAAFTAGALASHSVTIQFPGTFTISATLTGGTETGTSNSFQVIGEPDLVMVMAGTSLALPGDRETYAFTIENVGPGPSSDTLLELDLPDGWEAATNATCAAYPCALGTIGAGEARVVEVQVTIPADADYERYRIGGEVSSSTADLNPDDNSDSLVTRVVECPEIEGLAPTGPAFTSGELTWSSPQGDQFDVYLGPAGSGCTTFFGETKDRRMAYTGLEPGTTYEFRVVARRTGCARQTSGCVTFTTSCASPTISGVAETTTGTGYHVQWAETEGETVYVLQESSTSDFGGAAGRDVADVHVLFEKEVETATSFYYRVRPKSCPDAWSATLRVVVQPVGSPEATEFELSVEHGTAATLVQPIRVDGGTISAAGRSSLATAFTAGANVAWITVSPSSGTISGDLLLTAAIDTDGLPVGTSSGIVSVKGADGSGIGTYAVHVHAMTPVVESGKTAAAGGRWIIPAVAHVAGRNSLWRSDVRIFNPASEPAAFELYFTPSGTDGRTAGRHTAITVPAGLTVALADVVRHPFGYGAMGETAFGALEIRAVNEAARGGVFTSRTFNLTPDGTYGQFIPAVPIEHFASAGTRLSLQQVSQSAARRTNVGIVEGSGAPASVRMRVYDAAGHLQAERPDLALLPFEHRQIDAILAASGIAADEARLELEVVSAEGAVTAYASVVDNGTNDPLAVSAADRTPPAGSRFVVPGIAHFDSFDNHWRSDVRIYNPGSAAVATTLMFHPQGGGEPLSRTVTVQPGATRVDDNVVATLFGVTNRFGALHVATGGDGLIVTARTYDQQPGGTYGQFIPAMTVADAAVLGGAARQILHVDESALFRSNIGLAEVAGHPARVAIEVWTGDGRRAARELDLAPYEFRQLGSLLSSLNLSESSNARVQVRVTGGGGAVVAYSSTIDNGTQDPTYVPAQ